MSKVRYNVEIYIGWDDRTWSTDYVEVCCEEGADVDEKQVLEDWLANYQKNMTKNTRDVAFTGIYCTELMDDLEKDLGEENPNG